MGWVEFLQDNSIPHKKGSGDNVVTFCPWCGDQDRKMKMTMSTKTTAYNCWRNNQHRGWNPADLISALLSINFQSAESISQDYFKRAIESRKVSPDHKDYVKRVSFPPEFLDFGSNDRSELAFIEYLIDRGLDPVHVINRYNLKWCMEGDYHGRLIIPIYNNRILRTWTSRHISPNKSDSDDKYKTCPNDICGCQPFDFLTGIDQLAGTKYLMVVEGFFDKVKLDSSFLTEVESVATCGKNISPKQLNALSSISKYYKRVLLSLDKDSIRDRMTLIDQMSDIIPNLGYVECPKKDWGDCSLKEIREYFSDV